MLIKCLQHILKRKESNMNTDLVMPIYFILGFILATLYTIYESKNFYKYNEEYRIGFAFLFFLIIIFYPLLSIFLYIQLLGKIGNWIRNRHV